VDRGSVTIHDQPANNPPYDLILPEE